MSTQTAIQTEGVINLPTLEKALHFAGEIYHQIAGAGVRISLDHLPGKKQFKLYGVTDADLIKTICMEFELKIDTHQRRYAELFINYE